MYSRPVVKNSHTHTHTHTFAALAASSNWIVGIAYTASINDKKAVLLTPLGTCPWDINRDGDVDQDDLDLLALSSGCEPSRICWEDVNNDHSIDGVDGRLILDNWGSCPGFGGGDGFTESYYQAWLDVGGWDGLRNQSITANQVAAAMAEPTEEARVIALFALLAN